MYRLSGEFKFVVKDKLMEGEEYKEVAENYAKFKAYMELVKIELSGDDSIEIVDELRLEKVPE